MNEGELVRDIASVLNRHSVENLSDTPDFILAEYLVSCLMSFNAAVNDRAEWYGDNSALVKKGGIAMSKPINDGGPATRMWLATNAPKEMVESVYPNTYKGVSDFIGLGPDENPPDALLRADAKARFMWADAMLAEAARTTSDNKRLRSRPDARKITLGKPQEEPK